MKNAEDPAQLVDLDEASMGTQAWMERAVDAASRPAGRERLEEARRAASSSGRLREARALLAAQWRGEAREEQHRETKRIASIAATEVSVAEDIDRVAQKLGVSEAQVRRDHLISHVLAALSASDIADDLLFIGGTALSRTWLPRLRLSEDIDLVARGGSRAQTARAMQIAVRRGLQRSHGRLSWRPELDETSDAQPATVTTLDGTAVQIQLLSDVGWQGWPVRRTTLVQRYADAPAASLAALTPASFVAAKTAAWVDRRGSLRSLGARAEWLHRSRGGPAVPSTRSDGARPLAAGLLRAANGTCVDVGSRPSRPTSRGS